MQNSKKRSSANRKHPEITMIRAQQGIMAQPNATEQFNRPRPFRLIGVETDERRPIRM